MIDDDRAVRAGLRVLLEAEGYDVSTAADGLSGLAAAEENVPDLVVLDFNMPGMGGTEVLRVLQRRRPTLPVFFLTVYADFPGKKALDEADCCFLKSSDLNPMLEAIAGAVGPGPNRVDCPDRLVGLPRRVRRRPPEAASDGRRGKQG